LPFVSDLSFLNETLRMRSWRFLTPADAVRSAAAIAGVSPPRGAVTAVFLCVFAFIAVLALRRYLHERSERALASTALALMATVLFCLVGHVWPWFVLWLIPLAACAYGDALTVFAMLFATAVPLLDLAWLLRDDNTLRAPIGLLVYTIALGGTLLGWLQFRGSRM